MEGNGTSGVHGLTLNRPDSIGRGVDESIDDLRLGRLTTIDRRTNRRIVLANVLGHLAGGGGAVIRIPRRHVILHD